MSHIQATSKHVFVKYNPHGLSPVIGLEGWRNQETNSCSCRL
jgi:hypothetical protein